MTLVISFRPATLVIVLKREETNNNGTLDHDHCIFTHHDSNAGLTVDSIANVDSKYFEANCIMKIAANQSPDHDENVWAGVDGVEEQRQQQRREEEPWPDLAPLGLQLALSLWDALKSPTLLQDDGSLGRRFQLKKGSGQAWILWTANKLVLTNVCFNVNLSH